MRPAMRSFPVLAAFLAALAAAPPLHAAAERLEPGRPLRAEVRGGGSHEWRLRLAAGEYARVVVMQRGIDVVVTALAPDGGVAGEVDSPNGTNGPEPLAIAAKVAGDYTVRATSPDTAAAPGACEARVEYVLSAAEYARWSPVRLEPKQLEAVEGVYEAGPGRRVLVGIHDDLGGGLTVTDTGTRAFRMLHAHSATEFFTGRTALADFPVETGYEFRRAADGRVDGVWVRPRKGEAVFARRVGPGGREPVAFSNGGLTLRGTLTLPPGPGPHPAIVLVLGSGPATRNLSPMTQLFSGLGFAVLSYDKRGTGESPGDWRTAGFDELAGDAVAAVDYLATRADVDSARVGLWGVSQGGWVGSLAAARSPRVKFMVVHAGSGVPVWENVVHEEYSALRDAGLEGKDLEEGRAIAATLYRMAADGAGWAKAREYVATVKDRPATNLLWLANAGESNSNWQWWPRNGHVDPSKVVPQVRCPVLWFLGDRDSQVPCAESEKRLRAAFAAGGNRDATVRVLERAGHPFLDCDTGLRSELPKLATFVPGYLDAMSDWLLAHAGR